MHRPVHKRLPLFSCRPPKKVVRLQPLRRHAERGCCGYTLVEILVATVLSLLLLGAVVQMFGTVGQTIYESRAVLEATDRLRSAALQLQRDLDGVTVKPTENGLLPPVRPEEGQGYVEIVEGPIMETLSGVHPNVLEDTTYPPPPTPYPVPVKRDQTASSANQVRFQENGQWVQFDVDTSVGDFDDILFITTRSKDKSFIGRCGYNATTQLALDKIVSADVAEVVWFLRGRTLYRRVLLVMPNALPDLPPPAVNDANNLPPRFTGKGYYAFNDISVHYDTNRRYLVGNTLGDLTRRECRFAHPVDGFPNNVCRWGQLHLPTLLETSDCRWLAALQIPEPPAPPVLPLSNVLPDPNQNLPTPPTTDFWYNLAVRPLEDLVDPTNLDDTGHPNNYFTNVAIRLSNPYLYNTNNVYPSGIYNANTDIPPMPADVSSGTNYVNINGVKYPYRVQEDVILDNVIGFDVKVWDSAAPLYPIYLFKNNNNTPDNTGDDFTDYVLDPSTLPAYAPKTDPVLVSLNDLPYVPNVSGAMGKLDPTPNATYIASRGAYVDLGYGVRFSMPAIGYFSGFGEPYSGISAISPLQARTYDTWSTHYENTIFNPNSVNPSQLDSSNPGFFPGRGTNGFDDDNNGIVDDPGEMHVLPPYTAPLRGIQVKIRIFEPDSRQIREVTVVQDFLPQ
ncbi:MAG: hypothetical protein JXB10_00325 [Pirellulales bacterium]|nr:hypothetical protein [Pirellulales bacterium]